MASRFFSYDLDPRFKPIWWPFGVRADDGVTVDDDTITATYGWAKLSTPRSNVLGAHLTENYRWYTAVGIRLSFADDGLTFGTADKRGVCIHFDERVGGVIPTRRHSALTVTVEDCEGLIELLGHDDPR
jgi:hypothetical protein